HQIACGEYHAQIVGGIPMSQGEIVRLSDIKISAATQQRYQNAAVMNLIANGNTQAARTRVVELMQEQAGNVIFGASGLDEELEMIREQFRRFSIDRVEPHAHEWHLNDELIPMEIIEELAELGVFGLTIPEELGGFGLTKASMAVVSEELSRGYIGVGSLGTRSEIAAELIICGGTDEQKENWLPKLASGEILPTAVFTEPNTGSDLGALRTRAVKDENGDYKITGNKTWITHAARTHVMTLLARTNPDSTDHRGLSMFLAEKTPGTDEAPFPTEGVANKLAMMAVEITVARQLTYFSAFEKDNERRCDLEAGMAKLLGARVAWSAADNGLQIHGGNGFALEYSISRILCDARILNIFEGAAEIQAQVIARRLMD
ncbi:MAG: acyl-CoA dehydrogenase, partial [Rhodobacteraceae bacterium]|nr:acyl-CoA dehydrogenase [Paracoccaceae bacterium]